MASNTVVQTNVLALNSHRNLGLIGAQKEKASARLSSGFRINSASDDAAGLAISEKMRAQIRGLDQASRNAQDGISMLQTAEGGLQEISNMVQRIRELVVQAANDTNEGESGRDRAKIKEEIDALFNEISDMGKRVEFNNMKILDLNAAKTFQIGANSKQSISFKFGDIQISAKLLTSKFTQADITGANKFVGANANSSVASSDISAHLKAIDDAQGRVATARAQLGATINRLEYTNRSLQISSESLSASESRIRDADMAKEMMHLTKSNILQQAGISMLAQGNMSPQSVLMLLQ